MRLIMLDIDKLMLCKHRLAAIVSRCKEQDNWSEYWDLFWSTYNAIPDYYLSPISVSYYDPDMDYKDDMLAAYNAVKSYIEQGLSAYQWIWYSNRKPDDFDLQFTPEKWIDKEQGRGEEAMTEEQFNEFIKDKQERAEQAGKELTPADIASLAKILLGDGGTFRG